MSNLSVSARPLLRELADLPEDEWAIVLEFVRQLKQRSADRATQLQAEFRALSNAEILRVADERMAASAAQRFSDLLDQQQRSLLTEAEQQELDSFMRAYQDGLLRQAYALREAVQRGLREPLAA